MKTKLLLLLTFLCSINTFSQTDGWYLYTKVSEITKILPDDVNSDELHLATDIGYIKYNTSTNSVTDFLNFTSQDPAIGKVKSLALDPTSTNIAFTLIDGIGIYDGSSVTTYSYDNSNLTIGESTSAFLFLQVEYAKDGSLYVYKEDVLGYQIFNNGVFEIEEVTSFRPQDIIENNSGTKAYFAGDNNGVWELEKGTMIWTNHTSSNSGLISNFVFSFHVDSNDLLYIGGVQGLNTLSSSGDWNTYQDLDPINAFPYQVHDISINETTGDLVINTSNPSTYYYGLSIVDLDTNLWTNYREDGTNCLDVNVYTATAFGGDGMVYAAPIIFSSIPDIGKLVKFTPSTEDCSDVDINYLNAPVAVNSNVITDFGIREKSNGNIEIGYLRTFDFHTAEINPATFNGTFPAATTLTPTPGDYQFSVNSDNSYFILENNEGWLFLDENNTITTFNHNIPNYLAFITKKAANYNSDNGIINLVHKGFDASFNYRMYKTQCDTSNGTCAPSEEIFTTNRDLTKNILFGVSEAQTSDEIHSVAINEGETTGFDVNNTNQNLNSDVFLSHELWNKNTNGNAIVKSQTLLDILLPNKDPFIVRTNSNVISTVLLLSDSKTLRTLTENETSNEIITKDFNIDQDNNGEPDKIINSFVTTTYVYSEAGDPVLVSLIKNSTGTHIIYSVLSVDNSGDLIMGNVLEQQGVVSNNESDNLTVNKILVVEENAQSGSRFQNNTNTATMAMLTNYGLLLKTDLDLSQITLTDEEVKLNGEQVVLFPNPSTDIVSFSNKQIDSATVYDLNGRLVLTARDNTFSVKSLSSGVYLVKAKLENGSEITRKLIKN